MAHTLGKVRRDTPSTPPALIVPGVRAPPQASEGPSIAAAGSLAVAAAKSWWNASVERCGGDPLQLLIASPPITLVALPFLLPAEAAASGRAFAGLPVSAANARLGSLYTGALPSPHRGSRGIFYTPPALVGRLIDRAETAGNDWKTMRAIDPSCGAGAFLVESAMRIVAALEDVDPAIVVANVGARLRGWDLDPVAAWLAQVSVEVAILPQVIASGRRLSAITETRDSLVRFDDARAAFDLVMGNPAFGKIKDTPAIRARFRRSLYGHPNAYGLFTDLAIHLTRPNGGIIAYLTPTSYLAGNYFKALRRLLHEQARPTSIDIVEGREDVFADVLQEVALSCLVRGRIDDRADCAVVHVEPDGLRIEKTGTFVLPNNAEEPWILPRRPDDSAFVERMRGLVWRLADWGYQVSTGPLVWNRNKTQLHRHPGARRVPVVWAEAVTQDGRFVLRAERRNHLPFYAPSGTDDPNLVTQPCVLVQRTTAKEQHRRLICGTMPASLIRKYGAVAVENHLNMIRPIDGNPKVPVSALARFLATETADRILRCINASVAVSATELAAMPLPAPEQVIAAVAAHDTEAAIRKLYGIP